MAATAAGDLRRKREAMDMLVEEVASAEDSNNETSVHLSIRDALEVSNRLQTPLPLPLPLILPHYHHHHHPLSHITFSYEFHSSSIHPPSIYTYTYTYHSNLPTIPVILPAGLGGYLR